VSLRTLGIKSQDIVKNTKQTRNSALNITKAGISTDSGLPFIIVRTDARDKLIDILPEKFRKTELKRISEEISRLSRNVDNSLAETEKIISAITLVNQLKNKESQLEIQINNRTTPNKRNKKEMDIEKSLSQDINILKEKINNFSGKKGMKKWVLEQQTKTIDDLEFSKKSSIITKTNIERLKNELENVNEDNYNYYRDGISKNLQTLMSNSTLTKKQSGISQVNPVLVQGSSKQFSPQISSSIKGKQKIEVLSSKSKSPMIQEIGESQELDSEQISNSLSKIILNNKK
jgi:hypothetical protein